MQMIPNKVSSLIFSLTYLETFVVGTGAPGNSFTLSLKPVSLDANKGSSNLFCILTDLADETVKK